MPLESPLAPVATRVADLNARFAHHGATAVLEHALADPMVGSVAMVSSFGAESVALLHMLSVNVRTVRPDRDQTFLRDSEALLHRSAPDACCTLRKAEPLARALATFDAWITGRKRYQGGARAALAFFETDGARIKVNPLAHWTRGDVADYITNNRLPRHPLVARGFGSVGCAPCTSRVTPDEDVRAGRWRGSDKVECGIHLVDGRMVRI